MRSDVAIKVEGLGKRYLIGHETSRDGYSTLRDSLVRSVHNLARTTASMLHGRPVVAGDTTEEIWALKDVSFEVKRGEVLGIIGRNGAGKSTMLKVISRITEPTTGQVVISGRVASLLEVGTGFHPELTGRENIYLNGAILGMSRAEITRKFDQIVAFAGVERFLDTPVKRYSSGMYVRLAFAVAAHLEPEILIVDEVLAVGDIEFQKKCLGKMEDVANQGRTVVFVSHNLDAVKHLCTSGVVLKLGSVRSSGNIDDCVKAYIDDTVVSGLANQFLFEDKDESKFHITKIGLLESDGGEKEVVQTWDSAVFRIEFHAPYATSRAAVVLRFSTSNGTILFHCGTQPEGGVSLDVNQGKNYVDCVFDQLPLSAGSFLVAAGLIIPNVQWLTLSKSAELTVHAKDIYGSGHPPVTGHGPIAAKHTWVVGNSSLPD